MSMFALRGSIEIKNSNNRSDCCAICISKVTGNFRNTE